MLGFGVVGGGGGGGVATDISCILPSGGQSDLQTKKKRNCRRDGLQPIHQKKNGQNNIWVYKYMKKFIHIYIFIFLVPPFVVNVILGVLSFFKYVRKKIYVC